MCTYCSPEVQPSIGQSGPYPKMYAKGPYVAFFCRYEAPREGFEPPSLTTVDFESTALPGYAISA